VLTLALALLAPSAAATAGWQVSEADGFGWRRALVTAGDDRLAVVCPPGAPPFAVPVLTRSGVVGGAGRYTLGLDVDGTRHEQPMTCSDVFCEADLPRTTWRARAGGERVTVWIDDRRGPTFRLDGSAAALRACSPGY
jgi:hypothetical protein